jgi:hypothetical protein
MTQHLVPWRGRRSAGVLLTALVACMAGLRASPQPGSPAAGCDLETTDRVVAIGDVHGAYDRFTAILREAGLIDGRQRWSGGHAVFVQTGDLLDRGPDSRRALDLLRRLEDEAARAGGRVVSLLGNHEVMRMMGDLRYTSAGEYAAFQLPGSADLRERYYSSILAKDKARAESAGQPFDERAFRKTFLDVMPLGSIEMQVAFGADGDYGHWLRTHDTMAIVNGVAFLHGGTTPAVAVMGCAGINAAIRTQLQTVKLSDPDVDKTLIAGPDGPLWYRGLVQDPPAATAEDIDGILKALHARAMVVGHTVPAGGRMRSSFGGRVIQIDTGMLGGTFFPDGAASALELRDGTFTAIYMGRREPLPGR